MRGLLPEIDSLVSLLIVAYSSESIQAAWHCEIDLSLDKIGGVRKAELQNLTIILTTVVYDVG